VTSLLLADIVGGREKTTVIGKTRVCVCVCGSTGRVIALRRSEGTVRRRRPPAQQISTAACHVKM